MSSSHAPLFLDVLPPGTRSVRHELVIEPDARLDDWKLVASSELGLGPANLVVQPGEPFRFSAKYRTRLYAVSRSEVIPEWLSTEWRATHASAEPPVAEVHSVVSLSPIESILTTLRVERIDERALVFTVAREDTTYAYPQLALWIGVGALFVGGVVGLFLLRRRQRAKSGAACSRC